MRQKDATKDTVGDLHRRPPIIQEYEQWRTDGIKIRCDPVVNKRKIAVLPTARKAGLPSSESSCPIPIPAEIHPPTPDAAY
jgi:hypothetical protein